MSLTDQDPTQSCTIALVTDPGELEKRRYAQEDIFLDPQPPAPPTLEALVIGHYQLQNQLGKGSTGVVWKAVDLGPVHREVALKILHADYQDDHARIRFTNEVRALACLDDPHIAKVWDNGQTKDGRLFLAMELVSGQSLLKYCDTWSLTVAERIDLVIKICHGIQHAHQRAILHRDLKPANILVALADGQPVPKIIDFGLAKSMQGPLVPAAVETTQRGCLIGTIGYMSPEQAELDQRDVDVRSDVYALCAILYEMLTGTLPIAREELHRHSLTDALKLVRQKEPDLPSKRVQNEPGASLHAARCRLQTTALVQTLKGDLDAILMKGLTKDRFQRYQSAADLAEDLKRYLHGGVVQARQRTFWYVTEKLVRKHWKAVAALTTVLVLILGSWGLTVAGYFVVLDERNIARNERLAAEIARNHEKFSNLDRSAALGFLKRVFDTVRPNHSGAQVPMASALDASLEELQTIDEKPRVSCLVRATLARAYLRLGRASTAEELLAPVLRKRMLAREDQVECVVPVQQAHIEALLELDKYQDALDACDRFLAEFRAEPGDVAMTQWLLTVQQHRARALTELNRYPEAYTLLEGLTRDQFYPPDPASTPPSWWARLALLDLLLKWGESEPSKFETAHQLATRYLADAKTAPNGESHQYQINTKMIRILIVRKRYTEALDLLDDLVALANRSDVIQDKERNALTELDITRARVYFLSGDRDKAESLCQSAFARVRNKFGVNHEVAQLTLQTLIDLQVLEGDYWKALLLYRDVNALNADEEGHSKAGRQARRKFGDTFANAAAQWALWNIR